MGFLEVRCYSKIMLPSRISPSGGLICKNDFLGGGLFEGGLFKRGGEYVCLHFMPITWKKARKKTVNMHCREGGLDQKCKKLRNEPPVKLLIIGIWPPYSFQTRHLDERPFTCSNTFKDQVSQVIFGKTKVQATQV